MNSMRGFRFILMKMMQKSNHELVQFIYH